MLLNRLLQLSDRNPQLLREVKGRVNRRNVLVTLVLSLVTQLLIVGHNWQRFDSADGEVRVSPLMWRSCWFEISNTTMWVALTLLLFLGSYLLVKDIAREEKRSTLDFVRLSPASSQSVLLGKLLGVPILLYWAIALAIPLHVWSAVSAGLPLLAIVGVYLLSAISCVFVYSFALLHSMSWGAKAKGLYVMPLVGIVYVVLQLLGLYWSHPCRHLIEAEANQHCSTVLDDWFLGLLGFLLIGMSTLSIWFWRLCIHRFHHPPLRL